MTTPSSLLPVYTTISRGVWQLCLDRPSQVPHNGTCLYPQLDTINEAHCLCRDVIKRERIICSSNFSYRLQPPWILWFFFMLKCQLFHTSLESSLFSEAEPPCRYIEVPILVTPISGQFQLSLLYHGGAAFFPWGTHLHWPGMWEPDCLHAPCHPFMAYYFAVEVKHFLYIQPICSHPMSFKLSHRRPSWSIMELLPSFSLGFFL